LPTSILGISAFFHDSAAALVQDGVIVAASEEERFSRVMQDDRFPAQAAAWCLQHEGLTPKDLDAVVFCGTPLVKFGRILETALTTAPSGFPQVVRAMPTWLQTKLHLPREIDRGLGGGYEGPILCTTHHESHAASAFFPSQFERAAILTLDGVGEWSTATSGVQRGNTLELREEMRFPHSPGLLYSAFTQW
jgi:carbamoyltransferase